MSADRLDLVTKFSRLRPGMIVRVFKCRCPKENHRGMLLSPVALEVGGIAYPLSPQPACADAVPEDDRPFAVAEDAVRLRCVFRVEDDLDQRDSEELWREVNAPKRQPESLR